MNIKANKESKSYCIMKEEINAPINKVYDKVLEIAKWPRWRNDVTKVSISDVVTEGTKFIWISKGLKFHSKLHTIKINKEIGWTGKTLWISAIHNWKFTKKGKATIVTIEESFSGFGSSLMKKTIKDTMKKDFLDLKKALEK